VKGRADPSVLVTKMNAGIVAVLPYDALKLSPAALMASNGVVDVTSITGIVTKAVPAVTVIDPLQVKAVVIPAGFTLTLT
jgi:hypothetical protein